MAIIKKIVLTGGPCAGKTTALSWTVSNFEKLGWKVIVVNEVATQLIMSGIRPNDFVSLYNFQKMILLKQLDDENRLEWAAQNTILPPEQKILFVCDRGACDGRAYVPEKTFHSLLKEAGITLQQAFDRYDAVFHLVTAADGAEKYYSLVSNAARKETPREAILLDIATQEAWAGHKNFYVISNDGLTFKKKLQLLMAKIAEVLGESEPLETRRRFLINYPNEDYLGTDTSCRKVEILQTYLMSGRNEEVYVRQRGINGDFSFTKVVKHDAGDPAHPIELESRLERDDYVKLLINADPDMTPIHKTRYCFLDQANHHYFEIDIFPEPRNYALLDVDVRDKLEKVTLPPWIEVVDEVTYDQRFSSREIARTGGRLPMKI